VTNSIKTLKRIHTKKDFLKRRENINCVFVEKIKRNKNTEGSLGEALTRVRTAF